MPEMPPSPALVQHFHNYFGFLLICALVISWMPRSYAAFKKPVVKIAVPPFRKYSSRRETEIWTTSISLRLNSNNRIIRKIRQKLKRCAAYSQIATQLIFALCVNFGITIASILSSSLIRSSFEILTQRASQDSTYNVEKAFPVLRNAFRFLSECPLSGDPHFYFAVGYSETFHEMCQCPQSGNPHFYHSKASNSHVKVMCQCPQSGLYHFYDYLSIVKYSEVLCQCPQPGLYHFYWIHIVTGGNSSECVNALSRAYTISTLRI